MRNWLIMLTVVLFGISVQAASKVKIDSVRVIITEAGKKPVKVTMPYWVVKSGAAVTDKLKVGAEDIPMKEIIQIIDKHQNWGL